MNEDNVAALEINQKSEESISAQPLSIGPISGLTKIAFGICCYMIFAAIYFFKPNKPVVFLGRLGFTVDALLEILLTVLSLPTFYLIYRYGVRTYDEDPEFVVPELFIELLLIGSIIWIALGNGIHLTSKLIEQILANSNEYFGLSCRNNIHFLRRFTGHVFPHIGWQLLFAALMLGQLKRPYRGRKIMRSYVIFGGIVFGLLFTQGAIAAECIPLGFILTTLSLALFWHLACKSRMSPQEMPVVKFFYYSQITFLFGTTLYWTVSHLSLS